MADKEKKEELTLLFGRKKLIKIGVNAVIPNRASKKVAFTKINYSDYFYCKKHYAKYIKEKFEDIDASGVRTLENSKKPVWTLWLQGEENAPDIVKACWSSVRRYLPDDYELIVLDQESLKDYVQLSDIFEKRFAEGAFKMAHYSDIIRLKLLSDYGGYWIDSTVYCTNPDLFNYISESKPSLFAYKNILRNDDACAISSWFLYAEKNNVVIRNVYELLLEYWKKNKALRNYFLIHIMFTVVANALPEEWKKMPTFENLAPHVLPGQLFNVYDEVYFRMLEKMSSFHKLTYRIKEADAQKENTYYRFILSRELGDNNGH